MQEIIKSRSCFNCIYFNNDPEYIEQTFMGLKVMGSGYSSVRSDDGICQLDDRYLSGYNVCDGFRQKD